MSIKESTSLHDATEAYFHKALRFVCASGFRAFPKKISSVESLRVETLIISYGACFCCLTSNMHSFIHIKELCAPCLLISIAQNSFISLLQSATKAKQLPKRCKNLISQALLYNVITHVLFLLG